MPQGKVLTFSGRSVGGYIVHEQDMSYSREVGVLRAGQGVLEAGTVLYMDGGRLISQGGVQVAGQAVLGPGAVTGPAMDTLGHFTHPPVGILYDTYDTGVDADPAKDLPGAVYTARSTTVNLGELIFPEETTGGGQLAATVAGLKAIGIIPRLGHSAKTDLG